MRRQPMDRINKMKDPSFSNESPSFLMEGFLFSCFFAMLIFPNMVFSGNHWFQSLHLLKWVAAFVPIALIVLVLWASSFNKRAVFPFSVDFFALIWLAFLVYVTLQPLWIPIFSLPTFLRSWFFFAGLWVLYVVASNFFSMEFLSFLLWGSAIGGALSVFFAELQLRGMNGSFPFILATPGHYIANTGQQNMLGLWLAICVLNTMYLYIKKKTIVLGIPVIIFMAVIEWGLWNTTSRSAIFGIGAGILFMLVTSLRTQSKEIQKKTLAVIFIFFVILGVTIEMNKGRIGTLRQKFADVLENPASVGKRDSIWLTSWYMFRSHPLQGVGLGQYKWHYLEAQRSMRALHPEKAWQFTYWAHNEYLQWLCETGIVGGLWLLLLAGWWLWSFGGIIWRKIRLPHEILWGTSLIALILGTGLWTRPFHRIENVLWMVVAFAIANKEILGTQPLFSFFRKSKKAFFTLLGVGVLLGLLFLGQGMYGDYLLSSSFNVKDVDLQRDYLERAGKSFMVQDLAQKQLAYHYLNTGERLRNPQMVSAGLNRLYDVFQHEPHGKDLGILLNWGHRLNNETLLNELSPYTQ